jgi:uncharacterized protein YoxC
MFKNPRISKISNKDYTVYFDNLLGDKIKGGGRGESYDLLNGGSYYNSTGYQEDIYSVECEINDITIAEQLKQILNSQYDISYTPSYGEKETIPCRVISEFDMDLYDPRRVGMYVFRFTLHTSELKASLATQSILKSIFGARAKTLINIKNKFNNVYKKTITNINKTKGTINELNTNIRNAVQTIPYLITQASDLLQSINQFSFTIDAIVNTPADIVLRVESLMGRLSDVTENITDQLTMQKSFLDNTNIEVYSSQPSYSADQTQNSNALQTMYYSYALDNYLTAILDKDYLIKEDVIADIAYLDEKIIYVNARFRDREQSADLITYIKNTKVALQEKLLSLKSLEEQACFSDSGYNAYHAYYNNADRDTLINWLKLNQITDATNINKTVKYY